MAEDRGPGAEEIEELRADQRRRIAAWTERDMPASTAAVQVRDRPTQDRNRRDPAEPGGLPVLVVEPASSR
jgi:hypothetical protein